MLLTAAALTISSVKDAQLKVFRITSFPVALVEEGRKQKTFEILKMNYRRKIFMQRKGQKSVRTCFDDPTASVLAPLTFHFTLLLLLSPLPSPASLFLLYFSIDFNAPGDHTVWDGGRTS